MRSKIPTILCLLFFSMPVSAICGQNNVMDNLGSVESKVKEYQQSIKIPDTKKNARANEAASAAAKMFYSPEYQKRITDEQNRIKKEVFTGLQDTQKDYSPVKDTGDSLLLHDERIYVFISSSIPVSTLRNYAQDMDTVRDPNMVMVLRGFVGGMKLMKPTLKFIQGVITKDRGCEFGQDCEAFNAAIYVDPLLFRKYGINSVPAIVYAKGVSVRDMGASEGLDGNVDAADGYIVYGDVSIEHALEKIKLEDRGQGLKEVLKKLKGGYYH